MNAYAFENLPDLAPRQYEVLQLLSQGLSAYEIAKEMYISPHAVWNALANLREKAGARNNAHLVRLAYETGIL